MLRLTASYPVDKIDEPLVIKREGHGDQLSGKHGQIEIFRIQALQKNLKAEIFQGEKKFRPAEKWRESAGSMVPVH